VGVETRHALSLLCAGLGIQRTTWPKDFMA